jgi:hypothetical protein
MKELRRFTRNAFAALAAGILVAIILAILSAQKALCESKTEWILEQRHYNNGNSKIYIADHAVRIENLDRGFQIVAKAPTWAVEIFRPDRKSVYKTDLKNFLHFTTYGVAGADGDPTARPARKISQTVKKGDVIMCHYQFGYGNAWLATNISHSPEICRVLTIYNQSPQPGGVVLNYDFLFPQQTALRQKSRFFTLPAGKQTYLSTPKISKAAYNPSDFLYPVGYQQVKAYAELLTKTISTDEANLFMGK